MHREIGKQLLDRYLDGSATEAECKVVDSWYATQGFKSMSSFDNMEDYERIKKEMWEALRRDGEYTQIRRLRWRYATAVAALLLIGFVWFYANKEQSPNGELPVVERGVKPGTIGATLTLADGRKIKLAEANAGELAETSGVTVSKSKDGLLVYEIKSINSEVSAGQSNTLSTSKGETYMMILPDQSKVWLNAASSLTFQTNIKYGGFRKVKLKGEAYFEVAQDKLPFVVETSSQSVDVLGTHFNIDAYNEQEGVKTTLLEGAVRITSGSHQQYLKPGQQAINRGGLLTVHDQDTESAVAWKDGYFKFNDNLKTVMQVLARWYDVELVFAPDAPIQTKLWGYISRANNLDDVLRQLERTNQVSFAIVGRKVIVNKAKY